MLVDKASVVASQATGCKGPQLIVWAPLSRRAPKEALWAFDQIDEFKLNSGSTRPTTHTYTGSGEPFPDLLQMQLHGCKVWITCDWQPLPEYSTKIEGDDRKTISCFVPSEAGNCRC